tara:strand:- start:421 stop:885 length:465 start_codon:yes stop_codon:yes gene_type:complete
MMKLVTHVNSVHRRDFPVNDTDLLVPTESDALVHGEWMTLNSSEELVRASSSDPNAYMLFTPKGSTDAQSLGKVAVIMSRDFEVDTDMYDPEPGADYAVGGRVGINQVSIDGVTRSVFARIEDLAATDYVWGVITKAETSGVLRVHCQAPVLNT